MNKMRILFNVWDVNQFVPLWMDVTSLIIIIMEYKFISIV